MVVTETKGKPKSALGRDLVHGAFLQCVEAATLGMPFEVWKTRMGRHRDENTIQAFKNVYKRGGGMHAFYAGLGPKLIESASKGGILLFSKEAIARMLADAGVNKTMGGFISGAGGGVCQVIVMGPCTYLVTGAVTGDKTITTTQRFKQTLATKGIKGFYPGGGPLAWRQATNWASRQGFTEYFRSVFKNQNPPNQEHLTLPQEFMAGTLGGALSCWNHPFEVARIQMQASADQGQPKQTMTQVFEQYIQNRGWGGYLKELSPAFV